MGQVKDLEEIKIIKQNVIQHPQGNIFPFLKHTDEDFKQMGEIYMSSIIQHQIKSWRKHNIAITYITVPQGEIKVVAYDDRHENKSKIKFSTFILSEDNYCRIVIPPGIWFAFQGVSINNILLSMSSIIHNPDEISRKEINQILYSW